MRDGIKQARAALRRGDADGALVILWNELEPARLKGDRKSLRAIGVLATAIAQGGEGGQQAEAQRLLEVLQRAAEEGDATKVLEGEVQAAGYDPGEEQEVDVEAAETPGFRLGGLVWLLILIAIVIINVLSGTRD
ncbi:MAG: hypothetical protein WD981_03295 [Gaiellaceae bacterium]